MNMLTQPITSFLNFFCRRVCIRFGTTLELFRVLVIIRQALLLPLAQWIGKCLANERLSLYLFLPILTAHTIVKCRSIKLFDIRTHKLIQHYGDAHGASTQSSHLEGNSGLSGGVNSVAFGGTFLIYSSIALVVTEWSISYIN